MIVQRINNTIFLRMTPITLYANENNTLLNRRCPKILSDDSKNKKATTTNY